MLLRYRYRIYLLGLLVIACFSMLLLRLWSIQIVRGDEFKARVPDTSKKIARVPGVRGEIRDVLGKVLVENDLSYELVLNFKEIIESYKEKAEEGGFDELPMMPYTRTNAEGRLVTSMEPDIAKIINTAVLPQLQRYEENLEPFNAAQMQAHWRATNGLVPYSYPMELTFEQFAQFAEHSLDLPGVTPSARPKRRYRFGALAGHVLGYVQDADVKDSRPVDFDDYDYYVPDDIGGDGLEKMMDSYLRGKPGHRVLQFNEKGRYVGEVGYSPPTSGGDVYLTLDTDIQYAVELALRKIERGAAVVIDPNTGNILAMASVPSFDPQKFIPKIEEADWINYRDDKTAPLLNRALSSFAPGSTFKIPVAFAGCLAGIDGQPFHCSGSLYYGNLRKRCWIDGKGQHGRIFLGQSIKVSCNTFFYQYGNAAGINNILKISDIFGLGKETGIPLPGESTGRVPGPKWLRQNNPRERWGQAHTANVAIGQGDTECTPLQMASVVAAVANGGIIRQPRLVDRVRVKDADGGGVRDQYPYPILDNPVRLQDFGITDEQIETVRYGMWEVVNAPGGTARRAKSPIVEISGKTGTAQFKRKGEPDNHAWFVGFAPYVKPQFAVCVFVQGGKSGGSVAAPIMRKIVEDSLIIYKNRKDDEKFKMVHEPLDEAQGSFDFTELVSFDETLPPDALGDDGDDGSVVAAREAPRTVPSAIGYKPNLKKKPDAAGSRVANQPPERRAIRVLPRKRGVFQRFRRR